MSTIAQRVQRHRANLRASGLRPVQIWVPDTRRPGFAAECERQSMVVANAESHEVEASNWLERVADTDGWS